MSLSGITFGGLSSGLDTDSIISRLVELESIPITRIQTQQAALTQKRGLYTQLGSKLQALSAAGIALNGANSFNIVQSSSSKSEVATVSATEGTFPGTYSLQVSKLAQSNKISSSAQANASDPLGLSGKMTVNGKGVTIEATDSLRSIASKINATGGITASIIDGGAGAAYLTLTSSQSGSASKIQLGDLDGNVAQALGLANGTLDYRETITGGSTSVGLSSKTTALGSQLGLSGLGTQTFSLNGQAISVDLESTSLQDLAATINTSGSGATASVRSVTENGNTVFKLDLTGVTTYDDSEGVLQGLGILQRGFGNQLVAAQNAEYKIDGVSLTSATNTISNVIPGATITLLKGNETTPETSTLTFSKDDAAVKAKIKDFVNAYNSVVDFVRSTTSFDKETFVSGPLFGDSLVQQVEAALGNTFFSSLSGVSTSFTSMAQLGMSFDDQGKIEVNETTLSKAISTNTAAVSNLFKAFGTSTTSALSYVTSSSKTKSSGAAGYAVHVTQAAIQHSLQGQSTQTSPLASQEVLTFGGSLFGSKTYTLTLEEGLTQQQVVDKINSDSKLKDLVTATINGDKLEITSKRYGSNSQFTVGSDKAPDGSQSGIGTPVTLATGTDIVGTINGEDATGSGQVLIGKSGNAMTDGLQIMYTGNTTGLIGTMTYSKGIAPLMSELVSSYTDSVNGIIGGAAKSIDSQIETMTQSVSTMQERLKSYQGSLKLKFAKMEQAMSQLQSQSSTLSAMFAKKS